MRAATVPFSNKEINDAGIILRDNANSLRQITFATMQKTLDEFKNPAHLEAMFKVDAWRASHAHALRVVRSILRHHALKFDNNATVSGRSKRMWSIVVKLQRKPTLKVTAMQDVAGCRAIMETPEQVENLVKYFKQEISGKLEGVRIDDYIWEKGPKADGYRSVHCVVRYQPRTHPQVALRKIEVQVRTRLQHEWATAVETVDLFSKQTLKLGGGDERWRRLFALVGSMFAIDEGCPHVPGTPNSIPELVAEVVPLWNELHAYQRMVGWCDAMKFFTQETVGSLLYIVEVDTKNKTTTLKGFSLEQLKDALLTYANAEISNENNPNRSAVLVSADSIEDVKKAFPSYYGNTHAFLNAVIAHGVS